MKVAPGLHPYAEHCGADKAPVAYSRRAISTQVSRLVLLLSSVFAGIPVMAEGWCLSGDIYHELLNATSPTAPRGQRCCQAKIILLHTDLSKQGQDLTNCTNTTEA